MKTSNKKDNNSVAVNKMAEIVLSYVHPMVYAKTDDERLSELDLLAMTISRDVFLEVESISNELNPSAGDRMKMDLIARAITGMIHSAHLGKTRKARLIKISVIIMILDDSAHLGASLSQIARRYGVSKQAVSQCRQRMIKGCCHY